MTARTTSGLRRGALAALLATALLGGCASAGHAPATAGAASPDGMMRLADKARDRGELAIAASFYRKAYDADRQRAKPLVSLGQVLMEMQRPDQASEAFSAALVIEPQNLEALRGLGNSKLALREPEQAIPPLKQALAQSANDFRVHNALGVAHDLTGDRQGAHQYYRTGLKLAPDNAPLRSNYALSLALSGEGEEALETIAPLAALPEATPQQRQTVALVYGLAGDTEEAERLARMDLDDASVQANLQQIAALRGASVQMAAASEPAGMQPVPVAAVMREPLPSAQPKIEPVALNAMADVQPSAAPETLEAKAEPIVPRPQPMPAPLPQQAALAPAPVPAPAPAPDEAKASVIPAAPAREGWRVQLASYLKPEQATKGWQELSAAAPELLADREPLVEEGQLEDQTTVWRLRVGPYRAYSEAVGLCEKLKSHGLDCYVAGDGS
jgi:Flp pilus assembly protein TadD